MNSGAYSPQSGIPNWFWQVPTEVYKNDVNYIPEEHALIQWMLSPAHAFFNDGRAWLGGVHDQARLMGFIHPDYGENRAYFGFWETTNQIAPNQYLFGELEDWAKANGATTISGPIQMSTFFTYRLLTDDAGISVPFPREPYNPGYYIDLMSHLGYAQSDTYFSDWLHPDALTTPIPKALRAKLDQTYTIHPLTPETWLSLQQGFLAAIDAIFRGKSFYCPTLLSESIYTSFPYIADQMCPKTSSYATTKDGEIIGFLVMMPHRIHQIGLVKSVGVTPEHTKSGILFALLDYAFQRSAERFPNGVWSALTSETSRRLIGASRSLKTRQYGVFSKNLE